jgi:serine protease AprX
MSPRFRILSLCAALGILAGPLATGAPAARGAGIYIVEDRGCTAGATCAVRAVRRAGGLGMTELPIVNGVSAHLSSAALARLRRTPGIELFADSAVTTQGTSTPLSQTTPDIYQRAMVGVDELAALGYNGAGVTVAVVDSGILQATGHSYLADDSNGNNRIVAQFDAIQNLLVDATHPCPAFPCVNDSWGHGSHVTGLIVSSNTTDSYLQGHPQGIAPMARLVNVKAFDGNGVGSYTTVLNALNWVLAHRTSYGKIGVVNLSFGAKPQSYYWNDPIDQAVMRLWQAGIVVVASAGNFGPGAQTIAVPGNTPYVITVGAMTDNFTPNDPSDDGVVSFSSAGPTIEGFIKPDVVAPGGHLAAFMDKEYQALAASYPQYGSVDRNLFIMSGTSQAAAVTSGVVALMLQANPALTPDEIKCRLIGSAISALG